MADAQKQNGGGVDVVEDSVESERRGERERKGLPRFDFKFRLSKEEMKSN
jgi:hypothetical protein